MSYLQLCLVSCMYSLGFEGVVEWGLWVWGSPVLHNKTLSQNETKLLNKIIIYIYIINIVIYFRNIKTYFIAIMYRNTSSPNTLFYNKIIRRRVKTLALFSWRNNSLYVSKSLAVTPFLLFEGTLKSQSFSSDD